MVVWHSEVLQMPQLPDAILIAVIFYAPSQSFLGTVVDWASPLKVVRLSRGVRYVFLLLRTCCPSVGRLNLGWGFKSGGRVNVVVSGGLV